MKKWEIVNKAYPLGLDSPVRVRFRDGTESSAGTVGDWHGCGGDESNWTPVGDMTDIVAYEERV